MVLCQGMNFWLPRGDSLTEPIYVHSHFLVTPFATLGMHCLFSAAESYTLVFTVSCEYSLASRLFKFPRTIHSLPSNRPPPGQQSRYERYSLAFFTRPNDSVVLRPLTEKSRAIAESVEKNPKEEYNSGSTAGEWTARRIRKLRLRNRQVSSTYRTAAETQFSNFVP